MINSIRAVRRAKGLTLEEVGQRCDPPTTAQTIGRLEATQLEYVAVETGAEMSKIAQTVAGGDSSTTALAESTEAAQFVQAA